MALLLFIDDDLYTLEALTRAAQVLGHQALTAESGQEGLKLATEHLPDLIFLDMYLDDMDGITLIEQLRQQESTAHIPVFVLSASPAVDAAQRAQAAGAKAYLDKPIRLSTLLEIVQKYTSG